jgi:pimeloyl-ACP methyl ester carboxylesterase
MRLAVRYPELIKSLILIETTADAEPAENIPRYKMLNFVARWFGLKWVIKRIMPIMFGKTFLDDPDRREIREEMERRISSNHKIGITRAVKGVLFREGVYDQLGKINIPTLILVGDQDVATPLEKSKRMNEAIINSRLVIVPGAGHSSAIEEPNQVTNEISNFLHTLT